MAFIRPSSLCCIMLTTNNSKVADCGHGHIFLDLYFHICLRECLCIRSPQRSETLAGNNRYCNTIASFLKAYFCNNCIFYVAIKFTKSFINFALCEYVILIYM